MPCTFIVPLSTGDLQQSTTNHWKQVFPVAGEAIKKRANIKQE